MVHEHIDNTDNSNKSEVSKIYYTAYGGATVDKILRSKKIEYVHKE